jgi:hypothetical protein
MLPAFFQAPGVLARTLLFEHPLHRMCDQQPALPCWLILMYQVDKYLVTVSAIRGREDSD